jgi:hypothetical protein
VDCIIREIKPLDVDLDQPVLGQKSIEQKFQHLHVAVLCHLDALPDEFCLLVSKERLGDCRCSILGPTRATWVALGKGSVSRKFRVLSAIAVVHASERRSGPQRCR